MGKVGRTRFLAGSAWAVLRTDRELLLLPLISGAVSLVVAASFVVPVALDGTSVEALAHGDVGEVGLLAWILVAVAYVAVAYVTVFFNTAVLCGADERMQGGDPTLGSELAGARRHAGRILPWAVRSGTVSVLLRVVERRSTLAGIVSAVVGFVWSLATFLVLPVLVVEQVGVRDALRRSSAMLRRTWGENLIGNVSIGALALLPALGAGAVVVAALLVGSTPLVAASLVLLAVAVIGGLVWASALTTVFQLALYRYATTGDAPGFPPEALLQSFTPMPGGWFRRTFLPR